jgi:hypothetical protein
VEQEPAKKRRGQGSRANNFVCVYCNKPFLREAAYLDHVCTQMQRHQKMKTSEGMSAWIAYGLWMKAMGKKVPPQASFTVSQYYQSFIKFAALVQQVKTIDMEEFIRHMVKLGIPPVIWTNNAIYEEWIRSSTEERSPLKAVKQSCLFLLNLADRAEINVEEIFDHITSPQVSDWIRTGKVTPWLLFNSQKFKSWYTGLEEDDKDELSKVLDPSEWMEKIRSNPNTVPTIRKIVVEMGL